MRTESYMVLCDDWEVVPLEQVRLDELAAHRERLASTAKPRRRRAFILWRRLVFRIFK